MSMRGTWMLETFTGTLNGTSQYSWWISGFLCTFYGLQADRFIFKEHNVPSHKDQIVMESKHNEGITMLLWYPHSLVLAFTWNRLCQWVTWMRQCIITGQRWRAPLAWIWTRACIPRHILAVIDARGGHTEYWIISLGLIEWHTSTSFETLNSLYCHVWIVYWCLIFSLSDQRPISYYRGSGVSRPCCQCRLRRARGGRWVSDLSNYVITFFTYLVTSLMTPNEEHMKHLKSIDFLVLFGLHMTLKS